MTPKVKQPTLVWITHGRTHPKRRRRVNAATRSEGFPCASTVGDFVGSSITIGIILCRTMFRLTTPKCLSAKQFGAYGALPNDTTETPRSTPVNRQVSGSNPWPGSQSQNLNPIAKTCAMIFAPEISLASPTFLDREHFFSGFPALLGRVPPCAVNKVVDTKRNAQRSGCSFAT